MASCSDAERLTAASSGERSRHYGFDTLVLLHHDILDVASMLSPRDGAPLYEEQDLLAPLVTGQ